MKMEYNGVVPPINMNDPYNKLTAPPSSRVPLTGDFSASQSQRQSVLAQAFFAKIAEAGRRTEVALDQLVAIQGTPTPSIDVVCTALSIGTNNDLKTRDKAAIVSRKLLERMLPFSVDTETSIVALLRNASTSHLTAAALAQSPNLLSSHSIAFLVAARVKEILSGDLHDKVSAPLLLSSLDSFASYPSALGPLVELLLASTDNLRTQRGLELSLKLGPQSGARPSRLYWIAMSPQRNDELRTNACLALARFGEDGKPFLSRISHYGDSLVKEVAKSSLRADDIPVLVELKTLLSLTGEWTRALVNKLWSFIRD